MLQKVFIKSIIQPCALQSIPFPITVKNKYPQAHPLFSREDI